MSFEPRVALARRLAATGNVTAMIDLSDGVSRDLRHICQQSGVGAVIDAAAVPIHDDANLAARDGRSPLEHALHDGEDYELLFTSTVDPGIESCVRIGRITEERQILLKTGERVEPLTQAGWEHRF
jgi:thiamine-monophosphate kinase